jgi:hypothetical protein
MIPIDSDVEGGGWDQFDTLAFAFMGALTKDFGEQKKGDLVHLNLNFENGTFEIYDIQGSTKLSEGKMELRVIKG